MTRIKLYGIHRAVLRGDKVRLKCLVRRRKKLVDLRVEKNQCTPIMLAALCGQYQIARFLIDQGAQQQAKDGSGRTAADYAKGDDTFINSQLRAYKGYQCQINKNSRSLVYQLLCQPPTSRDVKERSFRPFFIVSSKGRFTVSRSVRSFSTGHHLRNKAMAFIATSGTSAVEMATISGWKSRGGPVTGLLDNAKYTSAVREVCTIMGFQLPAYPWDCAARHVADSGQGLRGIWAASHCEKKLAVYWVQNLLREMLCTDDFSRLGEVKKLPIPTQRRSATIYLTRRPCSSCRRFVAELGRITGVNFCLIPRPSFGKRAAAKRLPHRLLPFLAKPKRPESPCPAEREGAEVMDESCDTLSVEGDDRESIVSGGEGVLETRRRQPSAPDHWERLRDEKGENYHVPPRRGSMLTPIPLQQRREGTSPSTSPTNPVSAQNGQSLYFEHHRRTKSIVLARPSVEERRQVRLRPRRRESTDSGSVYLPPKAYRIGKPKTSKPKPRVPRSSSQSSARLRLAGRYNYRKDINRKQPTPTGLRKPSSAPTKKTSFLRQKARESLMVARNTLTRNIGYRQQRNEI
ncbi:hypothetical protein VTK73DRAFT_5171 [Phialemonium thermophilum]|uniref:Single-strand DNA deaminase toxin A-like C-terminal domain-containing protein n=1 Tax=Phialemonium thermophilum TaxID=223376 RepID=A0ABR3XXQ6_9PEZI